MKSNPINIILDTDIGTDSDDVGAMMVAHSLHKKGFCSLLAVTSSTSRTDGAAIIDIINRYYGLRVPTGVVKNKKLCETDEYGIYSKAVSKKYDHDYRDKIPADAVKVLRRALAEAEGKTRLITIGSFANIAALIKSGADEISPLSGRELIDEKVTDMYSMAGDFSPSPLPEFNVMLSLDDTIFVTENFSKPITFSPLPLGAQIKTGEKLLAGKDNPMKMAYFVHCGEPRESWDPITVYAAVMGEELIKARENVKVSVSESGITTFSDGGKDRILCDFSDREKMREELESLMSV